MIKENKEIQKKIISLKTDKETSKEEFLNILRYVSPGTNLRTAINGIVRSNRGALILFENEFTPQVIEGGFKINARFTPQRLTELAKMDGAIVLSKDMKRITHANVLLTPNYKIPSNETGTRHKAAERTAKMTSTLVIAVSERKNEINLYFKNQKYHLKSTGEIIRSISSALQILEKQRELFDEKIKQLDKKEPIQKQKIGHVCDAIQKGKSIQAIMGKIRENLIELGNEDHSIKPRVKELLKGVERETNLIIKDYTKLPLKKSKKIIDALTYDKLTNHENIIRALGRDSGDAKLEPVKGWRMLAKMGLNEQESASIIGEHENLQNILVENKNLIQK